MNSSSTIALQKILQSLRGKKFTGRIDIKQSDGQQWHIYLCLSRLVWADGGYHPLREWNRLLIKYFPELDHQLLDLEKAKKYECWNYYLIISLLQRFLITKTQAYSLIKTKIKQTLLDIYQAEVNDQVTYKIIELENNFSVESGLRISIALFTIDKLLVETETQWHMWQKLDLIPWNPHSAPTIRNHVLLKQQFQNQEKTYQRLVSLFNGQFTLIELADKLNLNLLKLMVWFKPYFESGIVELVPIIDRQNKANLIGVNNNNQITKPTSQQLIVCIDDSIQICEIMQHIITEAGYQFFSIQDPLKALPILIKRKPDLILLDLVMPIVNGYEICTQIRRVSALQNIPVIILTGNDGMIDRLRSKMVGANGFLSKPIDQEKLLSKIKSVLTIASTSDSPTQLR